MSIIKRAFTKRISIALILAHLCMVLKLCAAVLGGVATWAQLKGASLAQPDLYDFTLWILVAAAVVLALDPGHWIRRTFVQRIVADSRSNYMVAGFHKIREGTKPKAAHSFNPAHECLLKAALLELQDATGLDDSLRVNLILASPPTRFRVSARSRPGSDLAEYEMSEKSAVTNAMRKNVVCVVLDAQSLKQGAKRKYRCVAAVPIAVGKKCYGAISTDSPGENDFKGIEALLDRILNPYAAAILLTLPADAPAFPCPEKHEQ